MVTACFVIPMAILPFRKLRTVTGAVVASVAVLIGMWLERFVIVVGAASYPRSAQMWDRGTYHPQAVEIAILVAEIAAFVLAYVIFAKFFPLVSIWEVKETPEAH
jgi:molybdopterin-containing oxidoreductase family membrane subunit